MADQKLQWRINLPSLLQEIIECWWPWTSIMRVPFNILRSILNDIALRASELNDKELNKLMMRLALYEVADPYSDKYDADFVQEYLNS